MKRSKTLKHKFVEFIPDYLEENTVYVSVSFATVVHQCCCGCGNEVVTPLSPTDWKLTFDGQTISLYPSIGNWNLKCRSHYWIEHNKTKWARSWSQKEIDAGRAFDSLSKTKYYNNEMHPTASTVASTAKHGKSIGNPWQWLKKNLSR
jgi:hypothetical protein